MSTLCNNSQKKLTNNRLNSPSKNKTLQKNVLTEILNTTLFKKIISIVTPILSQNPAHDYTHSLRVATNALLIAEAEGGDHEILVAAALLHDVVSLDKNHPQSHTSSTLAAEKSKEILVKVDFSRKKFHIVLDAIRCHSFSSGLTPYSHEGKIFQDADRLDALGAIGIARTFANGATFNSKIYCLKDPLLQQGRTPDDKNYMVDHFFVKLFKIPSKMLTETGKHLALQRIAFMRRFLSTLEQEIKWI